MRISAAEKIACSRQPRGSVRRTARPRPERSVNPPHMSRFSAERGRGVAESVGPRVSLRIRRLNVGRSYAPSTAGAPRVRQAWSGPAPDGASADGTSMRSLVYRRELCKSMANLTNVRPRTNRLMMVALVGLAFAMCGGGDRSPTSPQPPQGPTTSDTLKAAAFDRRRLVGAAVQAGLLSNPQYSSVASREFNYLTAEYQMKWNSIEPAAPGSSMFDAGDAIVELRSVHSECRVKGHALIWHQRHAVVG